MASPLGERILSTPDDPNALTFREWVNIRRHGISLDYAQGLVDAFRAHLDAHWTELLEDK